MTLGMPVAQGSDRLVFADHDVVPGTRYGYRLRVWQAEGEEVLEPVWVTVPLRGGAGAGGGVAEPGERCALGGVHAAGDWGGITRALRPARAAPGAGRCGRLGAGTHRVVLAEGRRLPAGVYLVRLTHGARRLTAKACVVR